MSELTLNIDDLSKAPWELSNGGTEGDILDAEGRSLFLTYQWMSDNYEMENALANGEADELLVVLARNDLDVKMRRGWHTQKCSDSDQWLVPQMIESAFKVFPISSDCLDAAYQEGHDVGLLTKADAWWRANMEKAS